MTLTLDPRIARRCWGYARRFAPCDRWDRYQDGMLAILEGERSGRVADAQDAIDAAKGRQWNAARSERRERERRRRYAEWRRAVRREPAEGERGDVVAYLEALNEAECRAVVLRLWHHMEHDQVAAALGISRAAAKLRYQRGIARLRRLYRE